MELNKLIRRVKEKKSLSNINDRIIVEEIETFFKRNPKIKERFSGNEKSRNFKIIVKNVRNELNRVYGCFSLTKNLDMKSNLSTKERIEIYPRLYEDIFRITGKPKIILDLGCGLNPLSYKYIKNCRFIASELNTRDCKILKDYFRENNIAGRVVRIDLRKENKFPKADICFLFKVLDSIERKGHKEAERIIKRIDAKWIVASFPTITVRGNPMKHSKRGWFERMLKRLGLRYEKLKYENEIFYIIKKD